METSKTDIEIIDAILAGNKAAFKTLYGRYSRSHLLTCLRYVRTRSDAEDLLQESYITIFKNLSKFDPNKAQFVTWSNRVVINTCLMKLRKKNIFQYIEPLVDFGQEMTMKPKAVEELSLKDLTSLIMKLPKGYRTVFNMFVIDGFSHQEIADQLNISVSTSKSQLQKAKKALQKKIKLEDFSHALQYARR